MSFLKPIVAALALIQSISPAIAATLTWSGGSGTWDLSSSSWINGTSMMAWSNSPSNDAVFQINSGVPYVTVGSDSISAGSISFAGTSTTVLQGTLSNLTANSLAINLTGSGKLAIVGNSTLSNIPNINIANDASLYMSSATVHTTISVTGDGNTENRGAIRIDADARLQGAITLTGDTTFGTTSGTGIIESVISGNFAFNQASVSAGMTRITGNNIYTGGTIIITGGIQAGHNKAFGTGALELKGGTLSSDSTSARIFQNPTKFTGNIILGNTTRTGKPWKNQYNATP